MLLMIRSICTEPNSNHISKSEKIEELTASIVQTTITELYKNEWISALFAKHKYIITFEIKQNACQNYSQYQQLLMTITTRFPENCNDTPPIIKEYWEVQNQLTTFHGVALIDNQIVISTSFYKRAYPK